MLFLENIIQMEEIQLIINFIIVVAILQQSLNLFKNLKTNKKFSGEMKKAFGCYPNSTENELHVDNLWTELQAFMRRSFKRESRTSKSCIIVEVQKQQEKLVEIKEDEV